MEIKVDRPATLGEKLFGHAVLIIACVLFPGFFTLMAPVSVVHLSRADGSVRAQISKRVWFLIPYRRLTVEGVTAVEDSFSAGSLNRSGTGTSRSSVRSEDSAYLVFSGASGEADVEVSPFNQKSALAKARAFLDDATQTERRLIVVANWKFGVFAGGLLSLLTLFYVWLNVRSLFQWLRRLTVGDSPAT